MNPSTIAADADALAAPQAPAAPPEVRPEVPQAVRDQVYQWWTRTSNLQQRKNALFEYREANKVLFPSRFDMNDPRRGMTPQELTDGRDLRRVAVSYIYRDTLQVTAMTVPDDLDFKWVPAQQVEPPQDPTGMTPPTGLAQDPAVAQFAKTMTVTMRHLLDEADFLSKFQAWVQDACTYPVAVLKITFRREYRTSSLNANPGDKDESDAKARLEALMTRFAAKEFGEDSADYQTMVDIVGSLRDRARLSRWYGVDLQLVPMEAFGISEECTDLVNIYDAPWMFHDVLMTGDEILAKFPYRTGEDGNTYGMLPGELTQASPWDADGNSTDPDNRTNRTRGRVASGTNTTVSTAGAPTSPQTADPRKSKYLVRELWCKDQRRVYTMLQGTSHYLDCRVPQRTSERWYPFAILAPNRVPSEVYGVSDLELKRNIQNRINRKRSDEEKARWLSLDRYLYNKSAFPDEKEVIKLGGIKPGEFRGINLGSSSVKIADVVMPFAYQFKPEAFDTSKDERDKDMMGALPSQALGTTGTANFATEVSLAGQGAQLATQQRQAFVRRAIEGAMTALAEVLCQELTTDEVQGIAGAFALWPQIYDEMEAQQIIAERKANAAKMVAPGILQQVIAQAMQTGTPPDTRLIQQQVEQQSTPIWQAELVRDYGNVEPMTREALWRRMKIRIISSFASRLDKQQAIAQFGMLAEACMQMAQAAQGTGIPFNMRAIIKHNASLIGDVDVVDESFPAISPLQLAEAMAQAQMAQPGPGGGKNPDNQGDKGKGQDPEQNARNGAQNAPSPMGG